MPPTAMRPAPPRSGMHPLGIVGIVLGCLLLLFIIAVAATPTTPRAGATASVAATRAAGNAATQGAGSSIANVATATETRATPSVGAATPTATAMPPQVVSIKDNPAPVRESANSEAPVFATLPVGTELSVLGADVTGPDGATRWVPVAANGRNAFVRSDLVTERRAYVPATATPVPPTPVPNFYADYPLIDAADWTKRPDYYTNKRFSVIGEAFNVRESKGVTTFQMWVDTYSTGRRVAVGIVFENTSSLQDGQKLRAYGVGKGTFSGTNGFGATITQPLMDAERIGPPTNAENPATATAYSLGANATGTAIVRNLDNLGTQSTMLSATTQAVIATSDALVKSGNATSTALADRRATPKP